MHDSDDEAAERQRQQRERAALNPLDRLYNKPPRLTAAGDEDLREKRRKGRVVQMSLRMQLRVRAILALIIERGDHGGLPELFEIMLKLYLEKHGGFDESDLPSEEEMIRRYLDKRDEKDGQ